VDDPLLTLDDTATLVGVARYFVVARAESGELPTVVDAAGVRRARQSDVSQWYEGVRAGQREAMAKLADEIDEELRLNL
jgi:hypothetical protein